MRSTGHGVISFGMVTIPVKYYPSTTKANDVELNMLHAAKADGTPCHHRLKQLYSCPACAPTDAPTPNIPRQDTVRGFEFAEGQYAVFTTDELAALADPKEDAIRVQEFVPRKSIGDNLVESMVYLGPNTGGDRAYALLVEALRQTDRVAVGEFQTRGRTWIAAVAVLADTLVLYRLRYGDEVYALADVPERKPVAVSDQEVALAVQIVEQGAADSFDPEKYVNKTKLRIQAAIEAKIEKRTVTVAPAAPAPLVADLFAALKASLTARPVAENAPALKGRGAKKVPPAPVAAKTVSKPAAAAKVKKSKARA